MNPSLVLVNSILSNPWVYGNAELIKTCIKMHTER